jgi:hypothetical protein
VKVELEMPKEVTEKLSKLVDAFNQLVQAQLSVSTSTSTSRLYPIAVPASPLEEPTEEEKAAVEAWLKEVNPVIKKEAEITVENEIRQMMLMGGNVKAIAGALKKGKKPRLVRKKEGRRDPLYVQVGDGVEEPIEEIYIFG